MITATGYSLDVFNRIKGRTVINSYVTAFGNLILELDNGSKINAGSLFNQDVPIVSPSVTTLGSFDSSLEDVVIMGYNDGLNSNSILNIPIVVEGTIKSLSWSPDAKYLAVGHNSFPYLTMYKVDHDLGRVKTLTKQNIPIKPGSAVVSLAWNSTGQYLITTHELAQHLNVYERIGDTLSFILETATPGNKVSMIKWHPEDSQTFALASDNPSATQNIYRWNSDTDTIEALNFLPDLPSGTNMTSIDWSPTGEKLVVGFSNGDLVVYNFENENPIKILTLPNSGDSIDDLAWSPSGRYVAVASPASNNYLQIFKITTSSFAKMTNIDFLPTDVVYSVGWSPDEKYLAVGTKGTPKYLVYYRVVDTFDRIPDTVPVISPTEIGAVAWHPGGAALVFGTDASTQQGEIIASQFNFVKGAVSTLKPIF